MKYVFLYPLVWCSPTGTSLTDTLGRMQRKTAESTAPTSAASFLLRSRSSLMVCVCFCYRKKQNIKSIESHCLTDLIFYLMECIWYESKSVQYKKSSVKLRCYSPGLGHDNAWVGLNDRTVEEDFQWTDSNDLVSAANSWLLLFKSMTSSFSTGALAICL